MAKFVITCALLSLVAIAYAAETLRCYNCVTNDCKLIPSEEVACGIPADGKGVPACVKNVFTDKGVKNVTRKCGIIYGNDEKAACKIPAGATVISCDVCKENLCNGALNVNVNSFSLMALSTISLIFVKIFLH